MCDNSDWNSSQVVSKWTTSNGIGPLEVQRRKTNRYRSMMMRTMATCPPNSIGKVAGIRFPILFDLVVAGCIFGRFRIPRRQRNNFISLQKHCLRLLKHELLTMPDTSILLHKYIVFETFVGKISI